MNSRVMSTVFRLLRDSGAKLIVQGEHRVYHLRNGQRWITPKTAREHRAWENLRRMIQQAT